MDVHLKYVNVYTPHRCHGDITIQDEFHTRLKFNRRGLVGMVNGGRDDNGAQFFFTLDRADELNKKNTLFGKVDIHFVYHVSILC